jgi:hypothetical protein
VEPWVETIIRLWDDAAEYDRWSRAGRERAQRWSPERLAPVYRDFFGRLTHQPGSPLVPQGELECGNFNRKAMTERCSTGISLRARTVSRIAQTVSAKRLASQSQGRRPVNAEVFPAIGVIYG